MSRPYKHIKDNTISESATACLPLPDAKSLKSHDNHSNASVKRILIVAYKYFHEHPRIQREAAVLVRKGYLVDIICPRHPHHVQNPEPEGMTFYSPTIVRKRGSRLRYIFEYTYFTLFAFFWCTGLHIRKRYRMVQVFTMPEMLMLSCIAVKLMGAKILMDWDDPSREVFLAKFGNRSFFPYLLFIGLFEHIAMHMASSVITPNEGFRRVFVNRGHLHKKIKIVINAPDPHIFSDSDAYSPPLHETNDDRFLVLHHGTILRRHGIHTAIQALAIAVKQRPDIHLAILGDGDVEYTAQCRELVQELDLSHRVLFLGRVNIAEVSSLIRSASIGVIPNERNAFTEINFPQRIMEYGLLRTPLIVSRLPGIEDYICDNEVCFFSSGDAEDLADKLVTLCDSPDLRRSLSDKAYRKCKQLVWEEPYMNVIRETIRS